MKNKRKWIVFDTQIGYVVGKRKMTDQEADAIWKKSCIELDYQKDLGIWYSSNFITGIVWHPTWTRKEAQQFCDKANKEKDFNVISALLDAEKQEVQE